MVVIALVIVVALVVTSIRRPLVRRIGMRNARRRPREGALVSLGCLLGTALIASSDELHQAFLPDRTGMFSDVLLDCSGALVMLSLLVAALVVSRKLRSRGNA